MLQQRLQIMQEIQNNRPALTSCAAVAGNGPAGGGGAVPALWGDQDEQAVQPLAHRLPHGALGLHAGNECSMLSTDEDAGQRRGLCAPLPAAAGGWFVLEPESTNLRALYLSQLPLHNFAEQVVESRSRESNPEDASDFGAIRVSALTLVDLAGSERIAKTGAVAAAQLAACLAGQCLLSLLRLAAIRGRGAYGCTCGFLGPCQRHCGPWPLCLAAAYRSCGGAHEGGGIYQQEPAQPGHRLTIASC